ncbi:hypothetical protein VCR3J2_40140 [Vibrio coralliirubri]|nr:hypothetical protein VCR3J2_40140 [Vibrio coralliirubri]
MVLRVKSRYGMRVNEIRKDKSSGGILKSSIEMRVSEYRRAQEQMRDASKRDSKR